MTSEDRTRCFIAIPLSETVREKVREAITTIRKDFFPGAKWIKTENLHITLKFLGDIMKEDVSCICDRLQLIADKFEPYELEMGTLGAFPRKNRPRVIWFGTRNPPGNHIELVNKVEDEMLDEGFPREKKSGTPHISIARIKHRNPVKWPHEEFFVNLFDIIPVLCVNKIVLFKSTLSPHGAEYSSIAEFNL